MVLPASKSLPVIVASLQLMQLEEWRSIVMKLSLPQPDWASLRTVTNQSVGELGSFLGLFMLCASQTQV